MMAATLLVAGVACSSPQSSESDSTSESDPTPGDERSAENRDDSRRERKEAGRERSKRSGRPSSSKANRDTSDTTEGSGGRASGSRDGSGGGESVAGWPAGGSYSYDQAGYEEFCSGPCDREKLPPIQKVTNEIGSSNADGTTVVSETKASDTRTARTTFRFTNGAAYITEVYAKLSFGAFEYSDTYKPDPPVESLRFPFKEGGAWSGSWTGDVSGDYSVSVVGREDVEVGDRVYPTFVIDTSATFRGEYRGGTEMRVWIDPRTKAILRTDGNLHVDSQYGSYETEFVTNLRSGPGYR